MEGLATEPVHHPSRDWNLEVTAYCVLCRSSCVLCLCDTLPHGLGWMYRHVGEITCEYCFIHGPDRQRVTWYRLSL